MNFKQYSKVKHNICQLFYFALLMLNKINKMLILNKY